MKKVNLILFLFAIIFLNLVSAQLLSSSINPTSGPINQDQIYNITITNTGNPAGINFTQLNITLPSSFIISEIGGIGSSISSGYSFSLDGETITWSNGSGVILSGNSAYVWFNATAATGQSDILVSTLDSSSQINSTTLSINVSDSVPPSVSFVEPTPEDNDEINLKYIYANISASDSSDVSVVEIFLYDSSEELIESSVFLSSPYSYNFTGLDEGVYYLNATANDSFGNIGKTSTIEIEINLVSLCTTNWTCGNWTSCSGGTQTRTCTDSNSCGTNSSKPATSQSCSCVSSWQCSDWAPSVCPINEMQTRTCTDSNQCNSSRAETRTCVYVEESQEETLSTTQTFSQPEEQSQSSASSGIFIFLVVVIITAILVVAFILFKSKLKTSEKDNKSPSSPVASPGNFPPKGPPTLPPSFPKYQPPSAPRYQPAPFQNYPSSTLVPNQINYPKKY